MQINLDAILVNYAKMSEEISRFIFHKPCLFIKGERSDYILNEEWIKVKKYLPKAKLVTIMGAGHWVHIERPRAFLKTVLEFAINLQAAAKSR